MYFFFFFNCSCMSAIYLQLFLTANDWPSSTCPNSASTFQLTMSPCTESATIWHGFNPALLPSTMGLHSAICPTTGEPTLCSMHCTCSSQQLSLPQCMQGLPSVPTQVPFCFSATIGLPFASVQPAAQPCFHVVKGLPSATKLATPDAGNSIQQKRIQYIMYVYILFVTYQLSRPQQRQ